MTARVPAEVFHPGELVIDEMKERGWRLDDLVERTGLSRTVLDHFIADFEEVTPQIAEGLERAFGSSAQFWLNLDALYSEGIANGT